MTQYKSSFKGWQSMVFFAFALVAIFFVARAFFTLLYWIAPVLLIATAFINYKVLLNYVTMIGRLVRKNPIMGIGAGALSFFFYPVVSLFLFGQAMLYRKVDQFKKAEEAKKGEYVDYEEIVNEEPEFNLLDNLKEREEELFDKWELNDEDNSKSDKRSDLW